MAFTQLTMPGVCHVVGLLMMGYECGIPITVKMFEEMTVINSETFLGSFYISTKPKFKLITGFKSKVYDWDRYYFFVKIIEASMSNVKA